MKVFFILFPVLWMLVWFPSAEANASWLIYHKPALKGRIIDMDTKEPIKGAVVFAVYDYCSIIGGPAGNDCWHLKAKETLTDGNGEFNFPSYTTLIGPNSLEDWVAITVFKPGYKLFGGGIILDNVFFVTYPDAEEFFDINNFGKPCQIKVGTWHNVKDFPGSYGIVEIPKAVTWKERHSALSMDYPLPDNRGFRPHLEHLNSITNHEVNWLAKNDAWKNYDGKTTLISAATEGDLKTIKILLEKGVDVNYSSYGCLTALMAAAKNGHIEIVRVLLQAGADPKKTTIQETDAVFYAKKYKHFDIVKILEIALGGPLQ